MAVLRRQFFYREKDNRDARWCYLARNSDSGRVYVVSEWKGADKHSERQFDVAEFLATDDSTAQTNLLNLIGTLVADDA